MASALMAANVAARKVLRQPRPRAPDSALRELGWAWGPKRAASSRLDPAPLAAGLLPAGV